MIVHFKNKLMHPINAMLYYGYDNSEVGVNAFRSMPIRKYFKVDSDDVLTGEYMWIYVRKYDYELFKEIATPDKEYKDNHGEIIFLYKA